MIDASLQAALEACAGIERLLVASDYDGVVSPIVDDPEQAVPHPPTMTSLTELATLPNTDVVLISGRSVETLARLSGAGDNIALIGSHGAQMPGASTTAGEEVEDLQAALRLVADRFDGAFFEAKPYGGALHYRHAGDKHGAAEAARLIANDHRAKPVEGKFVVEAMLAAGDKGSALKEWQRRVGAERVIFFGDDVTDEAAFEVMDPGDVGVKVGEGPTAAEFRAADPAEVGEILSRLLELRQSG